MTKRYYLGIFLILFISTFSALQAQTLNQIDLPVTFEGDSTNFTLTDFEGAETVVTVDPTDSTNTLAITTKPNGAGTPAGTTIGTNDGFINAIPFTEDSKKMSVMVYSPKAGIKVRLKAEDHTNNSLTAETETTTTAVGWQKLVFDFGTVAAGTNPFNLATNFDMLTIFFDFGSVGVGDVYYWDDVQFGEGTPAADVSLSDLKVDDVTITEFTPTTNSYTITLEAGTTAVPTVTATTTDSAAVLEILAAEQIPGTTLINVLGSDGFTRASYSVVFKLPITDFPPLSLPIDFEEGPYNFVDFDGGIATVIPNPQSSGINTSATVAKLVKGAGAPWAGSKLILEEPLDFTTENSFSMKVFSPRADMPILLKLETTNGAEPDNIVNTTIANEWETLVWNYPDVVSGRYEQLVFMFDIGTVGDGSENFTFLFDDVIQFNDTGALTKIDLPVTFEDSTVSYELTDFEGAESIITEDPVDTSNKVAAVTRPAGSGGYAGTTVGSELGFASRIPFSENETRLSIDVYSPTVGTVIRVKVESHLDNTLTAETDMTTTVANEWETLVFDLSNVVPNTNPFNLNTTFDKASIFFNVGVNGNGETYYWDNFVFGSSIVNSSEENEFDLPNKTQLIGSYPNPFNPSTNIQYQLETSQNIEVTVFNINGQKIETLYSGRQAPGTHIMQWNAASYASGVYFVRLVSEVGMSTIKLMLQK